jgi:hypothetical protein
LHLKYLHAFNICFQIGFTISNVPCFFGLCDSSQNRQQIDDQRPDVDGDIRHERVQDFLLGRTS